MTSWKAVQPLPPLSSSRRHVGPPRPTSSSLMWRHQPRFYFSLAPSTPFPSLLPPDRHPSPSRTGICVTPVFLLRSVKRAETSRRSFFFYRTSPPLPSRFACPISICLSFCFQRSERDRNNLITGRCYVTRKNNCTTIYCDDSFLFFFLICKYNWLVVSIARFETFVRFSLSFSARSYACIFFSLSKNYRAGCFEFIFLYIQSSRDANSILSSKDENCIRMIEKQS